MRLTFAPRPTTLSRGERAASCREGRDGEASCHLSALLLFPHLDARPGPWLLLLAAACTFVAVRALEMAHF